MGDYDKMELRLNTIVDTIVKSLDPKNQQVRLLSLCTGEGIHEWFMVTRLLQKDKGVHIDMVDVGIEVNKDWFEEFDGVTLTVHKNLVELMENTYDYIFGFNTQSWNGKIPGIGQIMQNSGKDLHIFVGKDMKETIICRPNKEDWIVREEDRPSEEELRAQAAYHKRANNGLRF